MSPALLVSPALIVPACMTVPLGTDTQTHTTKKVEIDGKGKPIGEVSQAALSSERFLQHLEELVAAGKNRSARSLVERHPDIALLALRTLAWGTWTKRACRCWRRCTSGTRAPGSAGRACRTPR